MATHTSGHFCYINSYVFLIIVKVLLEYFLFSFLYLCYTLAEEVTIVWIVKKKIFFNIYLCTRARACTHAYIISNRPYVQV
jgi:hypothetical protein